MKCKSRSKAKVAKVHPSLLRDQTDPMAFKRKQPQSTAPYLCQLALGSNARLAVVEDAAAQSAVFLIRQKLLLSASSSVVARSDPARY